MTLGLREGLTELWWSAFHKESDSLNIELLKKIWDWVNYACDLAQIAPLVTITDIITGSPLLWVAIKALSLKWTILESHPTLDIAIVRANNHQCENHRHRIWMFLTSKNNHFVFYPSLWSNIHWNWDKMAASFETSFSNAFSWMKMYKFRLRFHWSFWRVQLTIS